VKGNTYMQKIFRDVDKERGLIQITVADSERWYVKDSLDLLTKNLTKKFDLPPISWTLS
jgi:hypothetical protein